jgi:hypothetical protein
MIVHHTWPGEFRKMRKAAVPALPACVVGLFVILGLLGPARTVHASPIVLDVSATTCFACWNDPTLASVNVSAQLTVDTVAGTFWDPAYTDYFTLQALMLMGISGTVSIDGGTSYSLSFVQPNAGGDGWSAPLGSGSWLLDPYIPRYLVFSADGSGYSTRIINDNAYNLFQWSSSVTGFGNQVPIQWTVTQVPELSSSWALMAVGVLAVVLLKRTAA